MKFAMKFTVFAAVNVKYYILSCEAIYGGKTPTFRCSDRGFTMIRNYSVFRRYMTQTVE